MGIEDFLGKFSISLNAQQREAVQAVHGPVLLLAVPGSGKTTVLVMRLGYMLYVEKIKAENILILTYTVAATRDMGERFAKFFSQTEADKLEFRTINSICAGIINFYGRKIGKEPYELVGNEKVLLGILSEIYQKYENEYPTDSELKDVKRGITYIKNMLLGDNEIRALEEEYKCHILKIYKEYCAKLRENRQMDYDDQMIYAYNLLKSVPGLLDYYQNKYTHICVDEAQDTSKIQHEIIALLAARHNNLFMVGDEDQSIYGFRAAYPEALLSFEKKYPQARLLLMEENFRSTANIVRVANSFIQKNRLRHKKEMYPFRAEGPEVKIIPLYSRAAQYEYMLKAIKGNQGQLAVLYRDNESVIPLVDLLERNNISYGIKQAELSFFSHRVIIDILNIILFAFDTSRGDLFAVLYYKLSFFLKKEAALTAIEASRKYNISIFSAIFHYCQLRPKTRTAIKSLETHFKNLQGEAPLQAINRIVRYMGYGEYMEKSGFSEDKIYILELLASREKTIDAFFQRLEELKEIIKNKENGDSSVILSTIHSSKGLEYDNVYLLDVVDGILPEEPLSPTEVVPKEELEKYEEARRVFYVGITRAKNKLHIFKMPANTSFIKEIESKLPREKSFFKRIVKKTTELLAGDQAKAFDKEGYEKFIYRLSEGEVIKHKFFGQGIIKEKKGDMVIILFDGREKMLSLKVLFEKKLLI